MNETVTLSIETYENMKAKIKSLKEQVREKTIVKEVIPPIYGYVALVLVFGFYIWVTTH